MQLLIMGIRNDNFMIQFPGCYHLVPMSAWYVSQVHPKYLSEKAYYDVGIAIAQTPIEFSDYIRPICLPTKPVDDVDYLEGDLVTAGAICRSLNLGSRSLLNFCLMGSQNKGGLSMSKLSNLPKAIGNHELHSLCLGKGVYSIKAHCH